MKFKIFYLYELNELGICFQISRKQSRCLYKKIKTLDLKILLFLHKKKLFFEGLPSVLPNSISLNYFVSKDYFQSINSYSENLDCINFTTFTLWSKSWGIKKFSKHVVFLIFEDFDHNINKLVVKIMQSKMLWLLNIARIWYKRITSFTSEI